MSATLTDPPRLGEAEDRPAGQVAPEPGPDLPPARRDRTPGWVWLTGVLLVVLVAWFVAMTVLVGRPSVDAAPAAAPTSAPPGAAPAADAAPPPPAAEAGPAGQLLAGGQELLGAAGGSLAAFAGRPVEARGVTVQSVESDESFWVGTSPEARVLVQLRVDDGPSRPLRVGQRVDLEGTVVKLGGRAREYGVEDAGSAALLERQGHVIEATAIRVR